MEIVLGTHLAPASRHIFFLTTKVITNIMHKFVDV